MKIRKTWKEKLYRRDVRPGLQDASGKHWLREEVGDSPRVCRRFPADNKTRGEGAEYFPADFVEELRKKGADVYGRDIRFPRGSLCLFQNAASLSSAASKSVQTLRVPTMSSETRESCLFLFHSVSACCIPPRNGTLSKATGRPRDCLKRY
ncbi:hypothetical protein E2C01_006044 [Portunus trituberculatus]|uniref:Uncharacterized protein n=1 Tax=Portunus trituberculatus TaxID=210409 RepID=A0A5B7D0Q9_PORTR|nr:hypothetical protein [Portunus trituberculatus]